MSDITQAALVEISQWVDAGLAQRDPEARTLHRVIKITEESGEVVTALIGATGANPRKGIANTMEKVLEELLDVAISALAAYEHIDGHQGRALDELESKILAVADRAGLMEIVEAQVAPCDATKWSGDYFRDGQVDGYWMRCNAIGIHKLHENEETGARWKA